MFCDIKTTKRVTFGIPSFYPSAIKRLKAVRDLCPPSLLDEQRQRAVQELMVDHQNESPEANKPNHTW